MSQKPTLRDVARAANAGVSTVSLALRDDPRIREDTRRHIQDVAAGLGYQTNPLIANLMAQLRASRAKGTGAALGLVNVAPSGREVEQLPTFSSWTQGILERAHALGYHLQIYRLSERGQSPSALLETMREDGVRALIFAGLSTGGSLPGAFTSLWERYPTAAVGVRPSTPPLHFSCNDQFMTALQCLYRLAERGYERPGLAINPAADTVLEQRFTAGFRTGHAQVMRGNLIATHPLQPHAREDFLRWFERSCPDVVVTLHPQVLDWLDGAGVDVPGEVGVAHLDCWGDAQCGHWSGMNQHSYAVGVAAVDLVVGQIHRNEFGVPMWPKCVLNSSSWVDGQTTRPLGGAQPRKLRARSAVESSLPQADRYGEAAVLPNGTSSYDGEQLPEALEVLQARQP